MLTKPGESRAIFWSINMHNIIVAIVLTAHYQRWRMRRQMRDTLNRRMDYMLNNQSKMIRKLIVRVC